MTPQLVKKIKRALKSRIGGRCLKSVKTAAAMKVLGFTWRETQQAGVNCSGFFCDRRRELIVKRSFTIGAKPKRAVPTLRLFAPNVYLQPLCDVSRDAVLKALRARGTNYMSGGWGRDPNDGNVGLFRGKPVQFDW